jgi:hypothetical protein
MPTISFRLSEEENLSIEKEAKKTSSTKTDYCKKLVLGHEVVNITPYQTIDKLIDLWEELDKQNLEKKYLDKLKAIILEASK